MLSELEEQQRVQVVVRGQRFELTVAVLSMYTSLFRRFFHDAFAALHHGNCEASVWQSLYNTAREELQQEKEYKQNSENDRIDDSTIHTNGNNTSSSNNNNNSSNTGMDLIVPVTAIEREERDGSVLWRFVYTSTLLAPDDVGVIFVYIRKLFQWTRKGAISPQPQLPIRWNELMYDGQLSVARVVCTFGVEPLIGQYDHPTAAENKMNEEKKMNGSENITECVLSARERAEEYLRQQRRQQQQQQENENENEKQQEEGSGVVHPSVGDDDLLLATTACSRCGITGHTDAECVR